MIRIRSRGPLVANEKFKIGKNRNLDYENAATFVPFFIHVQIVYPADETLWILRGSSYLQDTF